MYNQIVDNLIPSHETKTMNYDSTIINSRRILTIGSASIAGFLFGVNTGNIAGALPFIQQQFGTSTLQNEILVSSTVLFAALSALLSSALTRTYGLRNVLLLTGIFFLLASLFSGLASSYYELLAARIILGIAVGVSSYAAPLYIAEIAPVKSRGFFVLLNGLAITSGEAFAFFIDYCFSAHGQWRPMLMWSMLPALLFLIGIFSGCRSPRFRAQLDPRHLATVSFRQILSLKKFRSPLIIGIGLGVFQQFFGINTIMYYGPFIFEKAGFSLMSAGIWVTFLMGVLNILATLCTAWVVDIVGRRWLLLLGSSLASFSLFVIACLFYGDMQIEKSYTIVLLMMMYIIGYCMSVGSLFWLMISEIFPQSIQAQGASICTSAQWLSNFIVSLSFLSMINSLGTSTTFMLYAFICFAGMLFIYYWVPETKNRDLKNVELQFPNATIH